ncbi:MAG: zinc/manganese transport system ATP-binding protein [Solirubrobacteraceae bacterium]|nr:zinc/manganese transport system ATP-binding protein [Solirubrobacteraceae bacterium]
MTPQRPIAVELEGATLQLGGRLLWQDLDLTIEPGSFVAVLGPNGAGKTTMLEVLLGLKGLTAGRVTVGGEAPRRGDRRIGYVPQQRAFERGLPIRGRDLVRLGLDGPRFGFSRLQNHDRAEIDEALATVGALGYADAPIGLLSGGEQQRLRIAQALLGDRSLLLCDEPLLSLDPSHQHEVTALLDRRRRELGISVVFVTHEINPVLPYVDTVLYLTNGRWAAGPPNDIFTSERLSALYGTSIDVLRIRDRIVVVGADEEDHACHPMHAAVDG